MIPHTFVHGMRERYKAILPFLNRYKEPPSGAAAAARDLAQAEARDLVIHHHHNRHLTLETWPEFDTQGNPTYPKVGEKVRLKFDIGGLLYVADNPAARKWELTKPVDQRLAVLLVRLAQHLSSQWGASIIHWGGIGTGRSSEDRHGQGLALDFHGAVTPSGELNVWRDWGARPVPAAIGGDKYGRWPASARRTSFRLAVNPLELSHFVMNSFPAAFFFDLYRFFTTQATHGSDEASPRIGERSSILHPDSPQPGLRPGHQDHFHVEIDR